MGLPRHGAVLRCRVSELVTSKEALASTLDRALRASMEGRKGPSWVDIPLNFQIEQMPRYPRGCLGRSLFRVGFFRNRSASGACGRLLPSRTTDDPPPLTDDASAPPAHSVPQALPLPCAAATYAESVHPNALHVRCHSAQRSEHVRLGSSLPHPRGGRAKRRPIAQGA